MISPAKVRAFFRGLRISAPERERLVDATLSALARQRIARSPTFAIAMGEVISEALAARKRAWKASGGTRFGWDAEKERDTIARSLFGMSARSVQNEISKSLRASPDARGHLRAWDRWNRGLLVSTRERRMIESENQFDEWLAQESERRRK